jgi:hypothetical protein
MFGCLIGLLWVMWVPQLIGKKQKQSTHPYPQPPMNRDEQAVAVDPVQSQCATDATRPLWSSRVALVAPTTMAPTRAATTATTRGCSDGRFSQHVRQQQPGHHHAL